MKRKLKEYEILLKEINNKENKRCVNYRLYDHQFPCWDSIEDEYICDIDHINYRYSLIKEYITNRPASGVNACTERCVKIIKTYNFHCERELIQFLKSLNNFNIA